MDAATSVTVNSPIISTTGVLTQTGDTQIIGAMDLDGSVDMADFAVDVIMVYYLGSAGGVQIVAVALDIDADSATLDVVGAFSIDGAAASNVSTTGADLTLSTLTSGSLTLTSAADIGLGSVTSIDLSADTDVNVTALESFNVTAAAADSDAISLSSTLGGVDINSAAWCNY